MRKAFAGIFQVLSIVVYLVIVATLLIASPIVLGWRPVVVLSGSMEPAYPVGGIIYYRAAAFEDINVGDAITFQFGESSLATHRVVTKDVETTSFTTKGDNNDTIDPKPIVYSSVVGKASKIVIPYAGFLTTYIKNWSAIAVMGLVLLMDMLFAPDKEKGEKGKKGKKRFGISGKKQLVASEYFKDLSS